MFRVIGGIAVIYIGGRLFEASANYFAEAFK